MASGRFRTLLPPRDGIGGDRSCRMWAATGTVGSTPRFNRINRSSGNWAQLGSSSPTEADDFEPGCGTVGVICFKEGLLTPTTPHPGHRLIQRCPPDQRRHNRIPVEHEVGSLNDSHSL